MQALLVATGNSHKTGEIRTMLGSGYAVSDLSAHPDLPEVEETGTTFLENATLKAVEISKLVDGFFTLSVKNTSHLQKVISSIKKIKSIHSVTRMVN